MTTEAEKARMKYNPLPKSNLTACTEKHSRNIPTIPNIHSFNQSYIKTEKALELNNSILESKWKTVMRT